MVPENNGLPPFNYVDAEHLHLGGSSPFSTYLLYHIRAAFIPCDLLANLPFSTCSSIHLKTSGDTVTFTFGLISFRITIKTIPLRINIGRDDTSNILLSSSIGVPRVFELHDQPIIRYGSDLSSTAFGEA